MPVRDRRLLTSYTHLAFTAYDWLINLDEEIHCFWDFLRGRRPTVAALLYGLNRYPPHRCAHSSITNDISHVGQGACHCDVLLPEVYLRMAHEAFQACVFPSCRAVFPCILTRRCFQL